MIQGFIIIGYQGIGKSSCGGKDGCVDLESGTFFVGTQRQDDWHIPYCQMAISIAEQGYTVFVSSHKAVREFLSSVPLPENVSVAIFCPRVTMRDEWIERLEKRFQKSGLLKDEKALLNAKDRYIENIYEMFDTGLSVFQPEAMDYDLMDYVHRIRECASILIRKKRD